LEAEAGLAVFVRSIEPDVRIVEILDEAARIPVICGSPKSDAIVPPCLPNALIMIFTISERGTPFFI